MKKTFFISLAVLSVCALLLAVYNFAFRKNPSNPMVEDAQPTLEVSGPAGESESPENNTSSLSTPIAVLSEEKVFAPFIDEKDRSILSFSPEKHLLQRVSLDTLSRTTVTEFSSEPLRAVWSPDGSRAAVEFRESGGARWYMIDISGKTQKPLAGNIGKVVWTDLGDKILYRFDNDAKKEHTLSIANPDGSDWKTIAQNPFKRMGSQAVPQSSLLALWNQGNAFEETILKTVPVIGGEMKTIFSGKFGADYLYSPDGKTALVSSTDQKGGSAMTLGLLLQNGAQYQNLLIPTLVSKAVWSKDGRFIYYALPGALPDTAVLPNDYFSAPLFSRDTFWKMDIATGEKKRLIDPKDLDGEYDASSLTIDNDQTVLIFIDRKTGKMHRISLQDSVSGN